MLCFFDFSCSLRFCIALLTLVAVTSSSLHWPPLERNTFHHPCWVFWCFLRSIMDIPDPQSLLLLVAEFLNLYTFSQSYHEAECWQYSCLWSPQACRLLPTFCRCSLAMCPKLTLIVTIGSTDKEHARVGVCVSEACKVLEMPTGKLAESAGKAFPVAYK